MISTGPRLQGSVLAGRYPLEQWLGDSERAAFFRTVQSSGARPAVLKLIPESAVPPDVQLATWSRVARLSHPNLLPLFDSGQSECDGEPVLYAVFECPDETLQTALDQGPLTEPEALEILRALLAALRYVHSQGLIHAAVDARHIVAVGNQIKLSSDTIRPLTLSETLHEDVASLGALLVHILTGRTVESDNPPDISAISDPFLSIIHNTLPGPSKRRWTLSDIAEAIDPQPSARAPQSIDPQPVPCPPESTGAPPAPRPPQSLDVQPVQAAPQFLAPHSPLRLRGFPLWAYGALGAMLGVLSWLFLPKSAPPAVTAGPPRAEAAVSALAVIPPSPPPQEVTSESPVASPPAALSAPQPRDVWRVVAGTYSRYEDAERRAQTINQRWPESNAAVFAPNDGNRPPYLVTLGPVMNRDQAVRLLKIGRGKGLPRDTYIQNYPR